jgi:hypothetical protein
MIGKEKEEASNLKNNARWLIDFDDAPNYRFKERQISCVLKQYNYRKQVNFENRNQNKGK